MGKHTTHVQETFLPDGRVQRTETKPIFPYPQADGEIFCKYCHCEHKDWHVMDPFDYGVAGIVLCGKCGHTSKDEQLEIVMLVNYYELAGHVIDHVCETKLEKMREGFAELVARRRSDA